MSNTTPEDFILSDESKGPAPVAVDLGLSVKWADRDLGSASPYNLGSRYAWGELHTKKNYLVTTYQWAKLDDWGFSPDFPKADSYIFNYPGNLKDISSSKLMRLNILGA